MQGGRNFSSHQVFYQELYGIQSMDESAALITDQLMKSITDTPVIVLAHNGRAGLGENRRDLCGVDWKHKGGAHAAKQQRNLLDCC